MFLKTHIYKKIGIYTHIHIYILTHICISHFYMSLFIPADPSKSDQQNKAQVLGSENVKYLKTSVACEGFKYPLVGLNLYGTVCKRERTGGEVTSSNCLSHKEQIILEISKRNNIQTR